MNHFCCKDNYLSLFAMERFAKYICKTPNPCIHLLLCPFYEHHERFYRLFAYFKFNQEEWVYLGKTRKLKNIPSSRFLKKIICKIDVEVEQ